MGDDDLMAYEYEAGYLPPEARCESCGTDRALKCRVRSDGGEQTPRTLCVYCWETVTATRWPAGYDQIVADVAAMLHKLEERLTAPPAPEPDSPTSWTVTVPPAPPAPLSPSTMEAAKMAIQWRIEDENEVGRRFINDPGRAVAHPWVNAMAAFRYCAGDDITAEQAAIGAASIELRMMNDSNHGYPFGELQGHLDALRAYVAVKERQPPEDHQ